MNPYCFVITSYGKKDNLKARNKKGAVPQIDFDKIFEELIARAIREEGLNCY